MSPRQRLTRWLRTGVLAVALLGVLVFLSMQLGLGDDRAEAETLGQLTQLRELIARRELELMRSRAGISRDYDRLTAARRDILALIARIRIEASPNLRDSAPFVLAVDELARSGAAKSELIEQFKSSHSLLRNSLAFLPVAGSDAQAGLEASAGTPVALRRRLSRDVDDLLLEAVSFSQAGTEAIDGPLAELQSHASDLSPQARSGLDTLALHVGIVVRERRRVDGLLAAIGAMPSALLIDRIGAIVAEQRHRGADHRQRYAALLTLFSALLIAVLGVTAARLLRSHALVVRMNQELQLGNATLEQRVRDRTRELADADLIVRNSSTILFRLGGGGRFPLVYLSTNVAKFGLDANRLVGDPDWARTLIHGDDLERVGAAFAALLEPDAPGGVIEYRVRTADGDLMWVESHYEPLRDADGHLTVVEGVVSDISGHKAAEAELLLRADREARHHQVLDAIAEPVLVKGPDSRIVWGNRAFRTFYGMSAAELEGLVDAPAVDPDLTLGYVRDDAQVFESGQVLDIPEEQATRFDGAIRTWHTVKSPLFGSDGSVVGTVGVARDITEGKQAQLALRDSEDFLDRTGRIGGVGGWRLDVATMAMQWTDQTFRIHDLAPCGVIAEEDSRRFFTREARIVASRALAQCVESGEGFDIELPLVTASGRAIWVRAVAEAERVDGKTVRIVGAVQDITGRRALEIELRSNHRTLACMMENLPCGLSVYDAERNLIASNRKFRTLLDLPDTLFERPTTRLEDILRYEATRGDFGDDDVETTVHVLLSQARTPPKVFEVERRGPKGEFLEVRGGLLPDGGYVFTHTDISARREAENERRRSEQLLVGAIEAVDEGFVLFDAADQLLYCNETYRNAYGPYRHLLVPGTSFEAMLRITWTLGLYALTGQDEDTWVAERVAAHRAGNRSLVQKLDDGRVVRIVDRRTPDGHTVGLRADITELVRATEAAQEASLSKSRFLANMSHEIRTPMNAVLGMLSLLQRTELSPRQAGYAARTERAARSLLRLLDDILDFSKVEAGKTTLEPQPFRSDRLLAELAAIASASLGGKPIELLFDIDPSLPRQLVGDALRLRQVLVNLLGNAVKFTEAGEVVLSIAVASRTPAAVVLDIAVRDTGIGIAAAQQARIFDRFTQAEASTTRRFGGTGLGVAISQRLVALMGGELRLDSAPGAGSRFHFTVTLPVDPAATSRADGPSLHALIVEDKPLARAALERAALALGWSASSAASVAEAIDLLGRQGRAGIACDVIVVDRDLPDDEPWEAARRLRGAAGTVARRTAVLVIASHADEPLARRADDEPGVVDQVLVKPVTAAALADAVATARGERPRPAAPAAGANRRLQGLRVLLVEDNADNQDVARELLEDEGASVQIAGDGQRALDALEADAERIDVVLMDLQMPEMDGCATAAAIRQQLGLGALPIVAMTANVMASDRAACLAAGMNDHVGKPVDIDHLVSVLCRHCGRSPTAASRVGSEALAPDVLAAAGSAAVDVAAALRRMGGRRAVYGRLLASFVDGLPRLPAALRDAFSGAGTGPVAGILHNLKGLAGTLGARSLAEAVAREERSLRTADSSGDVTAAIERACAALDAAAPGLRALHAAWSDESVEQPPAAPCGPSGPAVLRRDLEALHAQLRDQDMAAVDSMERLRAHGDALPAPVLQGLDEAVAALDFVRAEALCRALLDTTGASLPLPA